MSSPPEYLVLREIFRLWMVSTRTHFQLDTKILCTVAVSTLQLLFNNIEKKMF